MDLTQLLQSLGLNQPQQDPKLQAYQAMMGGGHFGGVIPQGGMNQAVFRPPMQQQQPKQENVSFGASPWPGVWGI